MRLLSVALAAFVVTSLFPDAASAGDKFTFCRSKSATLRVQDAAIAIWTQWPSVRPPGADKVAQDPTIAVEFFKSVQASGTAHRADTLGKIYELFHSNAPIGGKGYVDRWDENFHRANTVLSENLLAAWSASETASLTTIDCGIAEDTSTGPEKDAKARKANTFYLLRDNTDDLTASLGNKIDRDNFPSPNNSSASIAFHHDQLDPKNNTFTMHAAFGVGMSLNPDDDNNLGGEVFLSADRVNNATTTPTKQNSTDLGAGAGLIWLHGGGRFNNRIGLHVQADTDDHFAASIVYVAAQASIWPTQDLCFARSAPITDYLQLKCDWNLDLDYAHIFNAGDFINLTQHEYARGGGDASLTLSVADLPALFVKDSGLLSIFYPVLKPLSASASYKVLEDLSGSGAGLSRFEASINYKLGGGGSDSGDDDSLGKSAEIALTFTNGRADRTLQPERFWELQLKTAL